MATALDFGSGTTYATVSDKDGWSWNGIEERGLPVAVTVVLTMVTGVGANVVALVTPAQEQTLLYRAVPEQTLA